MPITRTRTLYTAPEDDCHGALLRAAELARVSVHALIFGFTLRDLADVLIRKHQEGVRTGVVVDKVQSARHTQKALLAHLVAAGVPVTVSTSHGYYLHLKALLIDHELGAHHNDSHTAYGSYNFSARGQLQANSLVVDNDPTVCDYFWRRYQELRDYGAAHYPQDAGPQEGTP